MKRHRETYQDRTNRRAKDKVIKYLDREKNHGKNEERENVKGGEGLVLRGSECKNWGEKIHSLVKA